MFIAGNHVSLRNIILLPEMFKAGNHVCLEIIPSEAKLLLVIHFWFVCLLLSENLEFYQNMALQVTLDLQSGNIICLNLREE